MMNFQNINVQKDSLFKAVVDSFNLIGVDLAEGEDWTVVNGEKID
jgi:hypothetical protein